MLREQQQHYNNTSSNTMLISLFIQTATRRYFWKEHRREQLAQLKTKMYFCCKRHLSTRHTPAPDWKTQFLFSILTSQSYILISTPSQSLSHPAPWQIDPHNLVSQSLSKQWFQTAWKRRLSKDRCPTPAVSDHTTDQTGGNSHCKALLAPSLQHAI